MSYSVVDGIMQGIYGLGFVAGVLFVVGIIVGVIVLIRRGINQRSAV